MEDIKEHSFLSCLEYTDKQLFLSILTKNEVKDGILLSEYLNIMETMSDRLSCTYIFMRKTYYGESFGRRTISDIMTNELTNMWVYGLVNTTLYSDFCVLLGIRNKRKVVRILVDSGKMTVINKYRHSLWRNPEYKFEDKIYK